MIDRPYQCLAELSVTAPDPATADAAFKAALAQIQPTLEAMTPPVSISVEEENGQVVMQQP